MQPTGAAGAIKPIRANISGWYRWYMVGVLAVAGALAQIDRQIMGLLNEPVKGDLLLTDVQVSLLHGLAFVLFHAVMAWPLGYLSDKWPRRIIIAVGVLLWSLANFGCGLARSFAQLFAARLGVGFGEASLIPSVQSLLPDYFEADQLAKAFAVFQFGLLLGGGGAYVIGGVMLSFASSWDIAGIPLIGMLKPWQMTFMIAALPGPLLALLLFTMREPARKVNTLAAAGPAHPGSLRAFLSARRLFLTSHLGSVAMNSIIVFGVVAWTPSFLVRAFGWTPAEAGIAYGLILMAFGSAGTLISGQLAQIWARRGDAAAPVRLNIAAFALTMPSAVIFPLAGAPELALVCLALFSFCVGVTSTMMPTILQLATPHQLRRRVAAFYVFATSAVGAAFGPVIVAVVTDFLLGDPQRLSDAIAIVCGLAGPVAIALSLVTYFEFRKLAV